MSGKRIRIGQIGIGHNHAEGNMESLRKLPDLFEIVGVAEADPEWKERRGGLPCYRGLEWVSEDELLAMPHLDAVAVETDGFELVPTAQRCAERGLHVHLDKPGGESFPAFRRLLETCEQKGLAIQLAYAYRYNPAIRFAIGAVRAGWLGEIFEIHAVMSRYDGDNAAYRRWLAQFKGGAMFIFAGYLVDVVVTMLGRPDRVVPFLKRTRDDGLIDNGLAVLEYEHATATLRVSVEEVDGMQHRRLIVCGTEGTVEICPLEAPGGRYETQPLTARLTLKHAVPGHEAGTHQVDCGPMGDRYAPQLREFAEIIRGAKVNPFDYKHELLVQETLLAAAGYGERQSSCH
ncbi:MAG: Gfo/Idh/MocA family oxidoreductase [Candidatus Brocadiaceae bacterium]|nr:Gfo/Idh/MocA family oxidoreductase [Candidatus Brocadiaceae bacterium]